MSEREKRLRTLDEEIARSIEEARRSGELQSVKHFGRPAPEDPGWDSTPPELRMAMKILKDAGAARAEIEWFKERASLRKMLDATTDETQRAELLKKLSALEQKISLRLEALRINASL